MISSTKLANKSTVNALLLDKINYQLGMKNETCIQEQKYCPNWVPFVDNLLSYIIVDWMF